MGHPKPLSADELAALPVFPLPKVVLFPGNELPLHLFEPRYLRMIADCISRGPMAIAVAQLKPGWEDNYAGRPPIYPIAGVGRITAHERTSDGTYDIVLEAVARVRLEELPAEGISYRRARATVLHDCTDGLVSADLAALISIATAVGRRLRKAHPGFCLDLPDDASPGLLADRLAGRVVVDAAARQQLLETVDVGERVRVLTMALAELRSQLEGTNGGPIVH